MAQKVHFGYTQSLRPGLFTGNTMAYPLTPEQASMWQGLTKHQRAQFVASLGFEYEPARDDNAGEAEGDGLANDDHAFALRDDNGEVVYKAIVGGRIIPAEFNSLGAAKAAIAVEQRRRSRKAAEGEETALRR